MLSDFPFQTPLLPGVGAPDLRFRCVHELNLKTEGNPIYRSQAMTAANRPAHELHRAGSAFVLRVAGIGEFSIREDAIDCHPWAGGEEMVEVALLGTVLSFWLELRGIPALHASAVEVDGRAVVFLSSSQGGKSSLAAALMQAGSKLMCDDIVPVFLSDQTVCVHPGYPQIRMWPQDAGHFLPPGVPSRQIHPGATKRCFTVGDGGFGRFQKAACPLAVVLLPRRHPNPEAEIRFEPLSRAEAVMELTRHSFLGPTVQAVGLQGKRFELFAEIARRVDFFQLIYPSGLEYLPGVGQKLSERVAQPSKL